MSNCALEDKAPLVSENITQQAEETRGTSPPSSHKKQGFLSKQVSLPFPVQSRGAAWCTGGQWGCARCVLPRGAIGACKGFPGRARGCSGLSVSVPGARGAELSSESKQSRSWLPLLSAALLRCMQRVVCIFLLPHSDHRGRA